MVWNCRGLCGLNIINKINKQWYGIVLVFLLLTTGCSRKPEIVLEGFQTESSVLAEMERTPTTETSSMTSLLQEDASQEVVPKESEETLTETESKMLQVFVCGAVNFPGVYSLRENARVYEAVEAAGGFREDADTEWLNQAAVLRDEMKLYVYTLEETRLLEEAVKGSDGTDNSVAGIGGINETGEASGKVNLNTATKEQLMTLPGIGEAKADAVIAYREEQGSFRTIEDIMNISGIKEAVFLKIKDKIVV